MRILKIIDPFSLIYLKFFNYVRKVVCNPLQYFLLQISAAPLEMEIPRLNKNSKKENSTTNSEILSSQCGFRHKKVCSLNIRTCKESYGSEFHTVYRLRTQSTTTIDFSNSGSISFPVELSRITSLPEGQLQTSSIAVSLASGLSDSRTRSHVPPARAQNPA